MISNMLSKDNVEKSKKTTGREEFFNDISDELIVEKYIDLEYILADGIDKNGLENNLFKNGKSTGFFGGNKNSFENMLSSFKEKDFRSVFIFIVCGVMRSK